MSPRAKLCRHACFLTLTLLALTLPVAAELPITGRVLDAEGRGERDVEVTLEPVLPTYERARLRLDGKVGPEPIARTTTGADGAFLLEAPEAGMWLVSVTAPGGLVMEHRLEPLVEPAELLPLELPSVGELEVRVRDAAGKPAAATLGAIPWRRGADGWTGRLRFAATGEDGIAHMPRAAAEDLYVEALAPGFPLASGRSGSSTRLNVELGDGEAGTVRIVRPRNRPEEGALMYQGIGLLPLGLSDENGLLDLTVPIGDPVRFVLLTGDRWSALTAISSDGKDSGEDPEPFNLELWSPLPLDGQVLDQDLREPVAGAFVWGARGEPAISDARGQYQLLVTAVTRRDLRAVATGYSMDTRRRDEESESGPMFLLQPTAKVSGRVVDSDRRPLTGVEIQAVPHPGETDAWYPRGTRRAHLQASTRKDGRYELRGLPAGKSYELHFVKPGFAPGMLEVLALERSESRSGLDLTLRAGRTGVGQVVGPDDQPVAGAEVRLERSLTSGDRIRAFHRDQREPPPSFLTDREGTFEIPDLAPGRYDLHARASGFAPTVVSGVAVAEGAGETDFGKIEMVEGAVLEGVVKDDAGRPIAGATVEIETTLRVSASRVSMSRQERLSELMSDAAGRFELGDLSPGQSVNVAISMKGFGTALITQLRLPLEAPLEVVLRPALRLSGRVVDTDRRPIEGAVVIARPESGHAYGRSPPHARTGADGRFVLEDVAAGPTAIRANAEGFVQYSLRGLELSHERQPEALDIVLERGATVVGTVRDADGEPVAQAQIQVQTQNEGTRGHTSFSSGESDAEGRFHIAGSPLGPARVSAQQNRGGSIREASETIRIAAGENRVDLVFQPGHMVAGRVVGPDGYPVPGAKLFLRPIATGLTHYVSGHSSAGMSDADGHFQILDVPDGRYAAVASKQGFAEGQSEPFELTGDIQGLEVRMTRGATLSGNVLGLESAELSQLEIMAFGGQGSPLSAHADRDGRFTFTNLATGHWVVQARLAGGRNATSQVKIEEGQREARVDIEFQEGFTLRGVAIDRGRPAAGARLYATGVGGHGEAESDQDGRFSFEDLPAGTYSVRWMSRGGTPLALEQVELSSDLEIRLGASTVRVQGRVYDAGDGRPLPGTSIQLSRLDAARDLLSQSMSTSTLVSDSQGRFHFPAVAQGRWKLTAIKSGYAPGETTLEVWSAEPPPEIELALSATEGITFSVAFDTGFVPERVMAAVYDPRTRQLLVSSTYQTVEGKVRISTIPPGTWELRVQTGDSAATSASVTAPGDAGVVRLTRGGTLQVRVAELVADGMVPTAELFVWTADGRPIPILWTVPLDSWPMYGNVGRVANLPPGVVSFEVRHPDGRVWKGSATITPGAVTEVDL